MPDQNVAAIPADRFTFEPQDRTLKLTWSGVAGVMLSLLVIGAALYQARNIDLADVLRLVPSSPFFWLLFVISYFIGPLSEWFIFRKLWSVGPQAFGALVRKLIYNELLVGYLGEVYFYGWARKNLKFVTTPFGAVKDVAVLSAIAGNIMTLLFLAVSVPFIKLLPLRDHAFAIGWSLAFVIGTSLIVMLWRRSIFSLDASELKMVFTVHIGRILAVTGLTAALWHFILPETALGWWLVLATLRLLISRLPFIPNKDVVFAGVAVLVLGHDVQMKALVAMMAALILGAHLLAGLTFATLDLVRKKSEVPFLDHFS